MIINYDKNGCTRFLRISNSGYSMSVDGNSPDCVLKFSLGSNHEIATPYRTKQEERNNIEIERKGFLGLKKVQKNIKYQATVFDESKKGFAMTHVRDAIFDPNLMMPMILKQPQNIDEVIDLVATDPRFLYQINPSIIRRIDMAKVCNAASRGLKEILDEQSEFGIQYNEDEHKERISYAESCGDALHKFQTRWLELEEAKDITKEK